MGLFLAIKKTFRLKCSKSKSVLEIVSDIFSHVSNHPYNLRGVRDSRVSSVRRMYRGTQSILFLRQNIQRNGPHRFEANKRFHGYRRYL